MENFNPEADKGSVFLAGAAAAAHVAQIKIGDSIAEKSLAKIVTNRDIKDALDALEKVAIKYTSP